MEPLSERVNARWAELRDAERTVANYMVENPTVVIFNSASELAKLAGCSDATVIRTARALGYRGLPELKRQVGIELTRRVPPTERFERSLARNNERKGGLVEVILDDLSELVELVRRSVAPSEIEQAAELLREAELVRSWGLGIAGAAAQYASNRLARAGVAITHLDRHGFALANDLIGLRPSTCLLLLVPGRPHPDLKLLLRAAGEVGARSILVTNSLEHDIRSSATTVVDLPTPSDKSISEIVPEVVLIDILAAVVERDATEGAREARRRLTAYRAALE